MTKQLPKNKILLYIVLILVIFSALFYTYKYYFRSDLVDQFVLDVPSSEIYPSNYGGPYTAWSDPVSKSSVICTYANVSGKGYGDYCWTTNANGTVQNNGYGYTLRELWGSQVSPSSTGVLPWSDGGPDYAWENEDTKSVYVCNNEFCWLWNANNKSFSNNGRPLTISPGTQSNGTQPTQITNPDFSKLNNISDKPWGSNVSLTSAWRDPVNNYTWFCDNAKCWIYSDASSNWLDFDCVFPGCGKDSTGKVKYFYLSQDTSFWKNGLWVTSASGESNQLVSSVIYTEGPNAATTSYINNQTILIGEKYSSDNLTKSYVWSYQNATQPSWVKDGKTAVNSATFFPSSKYKKYIPSVGRLGSTRIVNNNSVTQNTITSSSTSFNYNAYLTPETLNYVKSGDQVKFELFNGSTKIATVGTVNLQGPPSFGIVALQKSLSQVFDPSNPIPQGNFKLRATFIPKSTDYPQSYVESEVKFDFSLPEPAISVKDTSVSANVITNTKASPITSCAAGKWCSWARNDNSQSYVGPNGVLSLKTKTNGSKDYGSCWIQFLGTSTNPIKADGSTYRLKADIIKSNSTKPYPSGKAFFQFEVNGNSNLVPGGISANGAGGVDRVVSFNNASKPLSLKFCTYGNGDVDDTISVSKVSFVKLTKLDRPVIWTGQNATVQQGTKITISMGNPQSNIGVTIKYCYQASSSSTQCTPSQVVPSDGVVLPVGTWVVRAVATKTGFADSDIASNTITVQQPAIDKPSITSITTSKTSYTQGEDVIVTIEAEGYGTTITGYSVYNSNATSISNPLSSSQSNTVTLRGLAPGNYSIKAVVEDSNDTFSDFSETTNFTVTQNNGGVQTVLNPTFSPTLASINTSTQISLNSQTGGSTIYYCVAGSTGSCNPRPGQPFSVVYEGAFTLPGGSKRVYAIATKSGMAESDVVNRLYSVTNNTPQTVATPTFSPLGSVNNGTEPVNVTITTSTSGASIYYCKVPNTSIGTTCTPNTLYSSPVVLQAGQWVVKAKATKSGMTDSAVAGGTYMVQPSPNFTLGDVNCSGQVNEQDATDIISFDSGLLQSSSSCPVNSGYINTELCDVNSDSVCNIVDSLFVSQCVSNIYNEYCDDLGFNVSPSNGNLIQNGDFSSGSSPWYYQTGGGSFSVVGGEAKITITNASHDNMQLSQPGVSLKPNTNYTLSFTAQANRSRSINASVHKDTTPWTNYGLNNSFNISTSKQQYTKVFTTSNFSSNVTDGRLRFWFVGNSQNGDIVYLDNISITEGGDLQPQTVATPTLSPLGSVNNGTEPVNVTITTSTSGASIYYCKVPNTSIGTTCTPTTLYSSPVVLQAGQWVVKAKATKSGMTDSAVAGGTYMVQSSTPQTYKACENNQCVQKTGAGTDSCTTNADCVDTTPLRDPVFTNLYTYLLPNEEIGLNSDGNNEQVEVFYCIDNQSTTSGLGVACTPNIKYIADAGLYMPSDKGSWVTIRSQSKSTESSRVSSIVNKQYNLLGDITEDGEYNILDIIEMIKVVFNGQTLQDQDIADMNRDDQINILDVIEIIKLVFNS